MLVLVIFALDFFIIYRHKELILGIDTIIEYIFLGLFLLIQVIIILM
jgi:hypothetical protein